MNKSLNKLMQKPMIQFFIIGSIMYLIYILIAQINTTTQNQDNTVTITSGEINSLEEIWMSRYKRAPTALEMKSLINQHLEETILFNEALKMGLNKNDNVIRQRMSQKLQFLSDDLIRPEPPTENDLIEYYKANLDTYKSDDVVTISQIYLDPNARGDKINNDAENIITRLNGLDFFPTNLNKYGDSFALQVYFTAQSKLELTKLFDRKFAVNIFKLEQNLWLGPIDSKYGKHLIYIHKKTLGQVPKYEEVKETVSENWMFEKQKDLNNLYLDGLLDRYEIIFEDENPKHIDSQ